MLKKKGTRVYFSQGLTISQGYQSWRIDAGVEMNIGKLTPEEAFQKAQIMVEKQLVETVKENRDSIKSLIESAQKGMPK